MSEYLTPAADLLFCFFLQFFFASPVFLLEMVFPMVGVVVLVVLGFLGCL